MPLSHQRNETWVSVEAKDAEVDDLEVEGRQVRMGGGQRLEERRVVADAAEEAQTRQPGDQPAEAALAVDADQRVERRRVVAGRRRAQLVVVAQLHHQIVDVHLRVQQSEPAFPKSNTPGVTTHS